MKITPFNFPIDVPINIINGHNKKQKGKCWLTKSLDRTNWVCSFHYKGNHIRKSTGTTDSKEAKKIAAKWYIKTFSNLDKELKRITEKSKGKFYIISEADKIKKLINNNVPCKIGITVGMAADYPNRRLKTMQAGNCRKLSMIYLSPMIERVSTAESKLHRLYKKKHISGEWFKLNQKDIDNIKFFGENKTKCLAKT